MKIVRCRKCRHNLEMGMCLETRCMTNADSVLYIEVDLAPEWIQSQINLASWTKGKVTCEKCGGRLGSFDLTNIKKCTRCREHDLSPLHIQKNRVDLITTVHNRTQNLLRQNTNRTEFTQETNGIVEVNQAASGMSQNELRETMGVMKDSDNAMHEDSSFENSNRTGSDLKLTKSPGLKGLGQRADRFNPESTPERDSDTDFIGQDENVYSILLDIDLDPDFVEDENVYRVLSTIVDDSGFVGDDDMVLSEVGDGAGSSRNTDMSVAQNLKKKHFSKAQNFKKKNFSLDDWSHSALESTFPEAFCCPICLDLFYRPHSCLPCQHKFCEPCLRRLARERPSLTPCPLCRNTIRDCIFDQELDTKLQTDYADTYKTRKHNLRKIGSSFYELPSCTRSQYYLTNNSRTRNVLPRPLWFIGAILAFVVVSVLLVFVAYYILTSLISLIVSLDSFICSWSEESWDFKNPNFFIYNLFRLAIHGCSWYNLYHQVGHYRSWYHYSVYFIQFLAVIQVNVFRCVLYTVSAELLSRFFMRHPPPRYQRRRI